MKSQSPRAVTALRSGKIIEQKVAGNNNMERKRSSASYSSSRTELAGKGQK